MKRKRGNSKAQEIFGMSFGMIFAIILIIFFIVLAIIVIRQFLCMQDGIKVALFVSKLNDSVDIIWRSDDATRDFSIDLPSNIKSICFANFSADINKNQDIIINLKRFRFNQRNNLFLYTEDKTCYDLSSYGIGNLDINKITLICGNPCCFSLKNGKGIITIEKEINEKLVWIR
jgi:hypothetical protein